MTTPPTMAEVLNLVSRTERGPLQLAEAARLREGLAALDAARRSAGGTQRALTIAKGHCASLEAEVLKLRALLEVLLEAPDVDGRTPVTGERLSGSEEAPDGPSRDLDARSGPAPALAH